MRTLKMFPTSINERFIDEAVDALRNGKIIIYPTDSVYALGCDAMNLRAIEEICRIKKIDPKKQHLSIVCSDISQASEYARIDNNAFNVLRRNLPGPFTFILPAATTLPKIFKGRKEVGVRIPNNNISRKLAEALGNPILTSSAQWTDEPITLPEEIADHFEPLSVDMIIDAGEGGTHTSAIVDLTDSASPIVVREGEIELQ